MEAEWLAGDALHESQVGAEDVSLVDEQAVLAFLGEQKHLVKEKGVPGGLGTTHSEAALGDELAAGGEVGPVPAVQQRLDLLYPDSMLVLALHLVYVFSYAVHGLQGRVYRQLAFFVARLDRSKSL